MLRGLEADHGDRRESARSGQRPATFLGYPQLTFHALSEKAELRGCHEKVYESVTANKLATPVTLTGGALKLVPNVCFSHKITRAPLPLRNYSPFEALSLRM